MALANAAARATFGRTTDWINKIAFFMTKGAVAIINEDPGTANHDLRVAYAKFVLLYPMNAAPGMAMAVITDQSIDDTSNDTDVENAVYARWDAFALARNP